MLTYGLECTSSTAIQMRRLESVEQSLGLSKQSHNTALLKALNIEKIEDIVKKMCYPCIFKVESLASTDAALIVSFYIFW